MFVLIISIVKSARKDVLWLRPGSRDDSQEQNSLHPSLFPCYERYNTIESMMAYYGVDDAYSYIKSRGSSQGNLR